MGLFDENDFDEQLWTDAWIDEVDQEMRSHGAVSDDRSEIQAAINSGLYSKKEIMEMFFLDELDLEEFDTFLLDDEM